jgi:hypothetical protein
MSGVTDQARGRIKRVAGALNGDKDRVPGPSSPVAPLRPRPRPSTLKIRAKLDVAIEVEGASERLGAKKALHDVSLNGGAEKALPSSALTAPGRRPAPSPTSPFSECTSQPADRFGCWLLEMFQCPCPGRAQGRRRDDVGSTQ